MGLENFSKIFPSKEKSEKEKEKEKIQKIKIFLSEIATKLKEENIPLNKDGRIEMEKFSQIYSSLEIKKDINLINQKEKEWFGDLPPEKIEEKKIEKIGEQFELLKTAILNKFIGEDFITVRSSLYDDIINKVDNVVVHRKTGNIICAFDEVGEIQGPRYEEKIKKTISRNIFEGGCKIKYGFSIENNKIILKKIGNIPIFYLALSEDYIKKGLKEFVPAIKTKSNFEEKLFQYFLESFFYQIKKLENNPRLNDQLKERLQFFKKSLEKYSLK